LLIGTLDAARESWEDVFPVDRMLIASAPKFASIPAYAEIRSHKLGWTGLYPSQAQTHVVQAFASSLCSDEEACRAAVETAGLPLADATVRVLDPGERAEAWRANVVAIGDAAASFDPLHNVDLLAIQSALIQLLAFYPVGSDFSAERSEYNRLMRSIYERLRDFQALHYRINGYGGAFWARARARQGEISPELAHRIALFQARGEIAPYEDESFAPDSWRAFFIGHGLVPDSYLPVIDRTPPEEIKAQFRHMLGYVKEQVLRQPTHDAYLQTIARRGHG
jgi:tryptophan halogenase